MAVRAKFFVRAIEMYAQPPETGTVKLVAVVNNSDDNKSWSKYTPSGSIEMHITNPEAFKQFQIGTEVFVDFSPAAPPVPSE